MSRLIFVEKLLGDSRRAAAEEVNRHALTGHVLRNLQTDRAVGDCIK
jgi:hypothetical protein